MSLVAIGLFTSPPSALAGSGGSGAYGFNDGGTVFVNLPGGGSPGGDVPAGPAGPRPSRPRVCSSRNYQVHQGPGGEFYSDELWCRGVFVRARVFGATVGGPAGGGGPPPPPPPSGEDVAQEAFASFRLATPGIGTTSDGGVVRFPQWFWLTGGWAEQSATASLGVISATVVAKPMFATWRPGDGTTFTCDNPGMVYRGPQDAHLRPSCAHEFTRSSALEPGKRYQVTVRVSYSMTWTATDGTSGDLGTITSPAGSTTAGVGEIQAINVPNPPGVGGGG